MIDLHHLPGREQFAGLFWSILAVGACVALLLPPFAVRMEQPLPAFLAYALFSPICHQIPDRCLQLWGIPMALCTRCTGLVVGFLLGLLSRLPWNDGSRLPRRLWLFATGLVLLFDVVAPTLHVYENSRMTRLATGAGFGFVVAWFAVPGLASLLELLVRRDAGSRLGGTSKHPFSGEMAGYEQ